MVSGKLACTSRNLKQYSNLDFNTEFLIQFGMYFHPKNLIKPRFNILHSRNPLWIRSVLRVLGMYNFAFSGRRLCYRGFIGGTAVGVP